MSVIIIIGGSGRARAAIDEMNRKASTDHWTQAQKTNAGEILNDFADRIEAFNAAPQPPA